MFKTGNQQQQQQQQQQKRLPGQNVRGAKTDLDDDYYYTNGI